MVLNRNRMSNWRAWCLLCCLLLLGACSSTTFVYNRLDFILPWYVDDYAELNTQQDAYLDELLAPRHQFFTDTDVASVSPLSLSGDAAIQPRDRRTGGPMMA